MKKIGIVIIAISMIFSCSCTWEDPGKIDLKRRVQPIGDEGGLSYGVYNMDGEIEATNEFIIGADEQFEKIFCIGNYYENDIEFTMVILENFKTTDFFVDDKSYRAYDFVVKAGDYVQIPFIIEQITESCEIDILLFKNLDDHSTDMDFRQNTGISNFLAYCCTINTPIEKKKIDVKSADVYGQIRQNSDLDGIFLNGEEEMSFCATMDVENVYEDFYMHIGNTSSQDRQAVILLFDGTEIISINGNKALYIDIPEETMLDIKMKDVSLDPGVIHELSAALFLMEDNRVDRVTTSSRILVR